VAAWKKAEGDEVAAGDSIAEIETDKARHCPRLHLHMPVQQNMEV
jgi:hypothetical protein